VKLTASQSASSSDSNSPEADALIAAIGRLIEALRQELFEYGETLALLDQQRRPLQSCAGEEVWQSILALQGHLATVNTARQKRQTRWGELACALGAAPETSADTILGRLPDKYRLPVEALLQENSHLLVRLRQSVEVNHRLLGLAVQSLRQFLQALELPLSPPSPRVEEASQAGTPLSQNPLAAVR
jgi:hypothetical protein